MPEQADEFITYRGWKLKVLSVTKHFPVVRRDKDGQIIKRTNYQIEAVAEEVQPPKEKRGYEFL